MKLKPPRLVQIVSILGSFVALLYLADFWTAPLTASLDHSWIAVIGWAASRHLQFGKDIIFTYGPLGYLLYPINFPAIYWQALILKTAIHTLLLIMLFVLSAKLHPVRGAILFLTTIVAASYHPLTTQVLMIVAASWLVFADVRCSRPLQMVCMSFLAMTLLMKGTNVILVPVLLAAGWGYLIYRRDTRSLLLTFVTFVLALVIAWTAAGQDLSNFPSYARSMLAVAASYGEAMSVAPTPALLALGLIGLGLLVLHIVAAWFPLRSESRAWWVSFVLGMVLFMVWKMSFTRADVHTNQLFFYGIPVTLALPAFYGRQRLRMPRSLDYAIIAGVLACGLAVIHETTHLTLTSVYRHAQSRLRSNFRMLLAIGTPKAKAEESYDKEARKLALPRIRQTVGNSTVDVFGSQQAVAIANGLNYTPRPVIQGYVAQGRWLARKNGDFYRSAQAPQYVIFKLQTIEAHLPTLDDADALLVLARQYEPVLTENGYTLLHRKPDGELPRQFEPVGTGDVAPDEIVRVPNGPIWCELQIRKTLLGRLVSFLYQFPDTYMLAQRSDGAMLRHRIISQSASNGFLLSPLPETETEFADLTGGNYGRTAVQSIRILRPKKWKWYFQPRMSYRFSRIALPANPQQPGER